ncbi:uncharacterized protein LOC116290544 [Actinia tenebrosa]|uniref:Uncharacterized protein LOC116290544 n=1 Tax=Actinia tenebrosa TaxID=6105 RepID=A0A6P8HLH3_ACTTE|nr:uncharacterized protein LOC116290544 [Actinia tenebrosa]
MEGNQIIKLNVGGIIYHTTKNTLLFEHDSLLAKLSRGESQLGLMFTGSLEKTNSGKEVNEDVEIFIDRDGTNFKYLLNYLRSGHLVLPEEENVLREILLEAKYYNIKGVIDELSKPCYKIKGVVPISDELGAFWESLILDNEKKRFLESWCGGEGKKFKLLYRATRDGWSADIFHFLCDNKAPTVVVTRKGSSVFGGYTEKSWSGTGNKTDKNAFLFSLSNPSGLGPIKIQLNEGEEEDAVYCHPSQGPVFGKGRDLVISDQANVSHCSSRLDNTYKCPANQISTLFLAGTLTFTLAELEVYEILSIAYWLDQDYMRRGEYNTCCYWLDLTVYYFSRCIDHTKAKSIVWISEFEFGRLVSKKRFKNMEKLREKRQAMQEQLEEIEKREMLAKKKLNWLEEISGKNKTEAETLRRSCSLTEYNLDKTEDLLDQKIASLKSALVKRDKEDQIIKVLEQRDLEIDEEISRFEPKVKQAIHRADEAEMKYHEAVRKLSLAESERNKVIGRRNAKENQVQALQTSLKNAGRQIHRLAISEEKSGDREDEYFRRCRHLTECVSHCLMRAEEAERRIKMLQNRKDNLEGEKKTYEKNLAMMRRELDETLNNLDHL